MSGINSKILINATVKSGREPPETPEMIKKEIKKKKCSSSSKASEIIVAI